MHKLAIAIVGAGTAGLAAAVFFARNGHSVTLYERFDTPKPLGAGLLLQPTGLSVLHCLGIDKQIIAAGSRIDKLYGKVSGSRFTTLDVQYKTVNPNLFGIGIHRGVLFSSLYNLVKESETKIVPAHSVMSIRSEGCVSRLVFASGDVSEPFDLVVDASGAKSTLRGLYANVKLDKPYPYGAVWGIVKNTNDVFAIDTLAQRYKRADRMAGILPVGKGSGQKCESLAFFWSLKVADYPHWREQAFAKWQESVSELWPETKIAISQFKTHDDLTFATYRDVILKTYHSGNIVFIGDAAHCTSPQLGQGANLALMDAMVLAQCVQEGHNLDEALQAYAARRKKHIRFYQMYSRLLTPFFQSDSYILPILRGLACSVACKIPFTQKIAAYVLSGAKTGIFSTLNPGEWAKEYDLFALANRQDSH